MTNSLILQRPSSAECEAEKKVKKNNSLLVNPT